MRVSSIYHSFLVATWLSAVSLMMVGFISGGGSNTLGAYFLAQLGSVINVTASVPPNEYNTLAQQLQDKEDELRLREAALARQEGSPGSSAVDKSEVDPALATLSTLGFLLSIYMPFHFFHDWKNHQRENNHVLHA